MFSPSIRCFLAGLGLTGATLFGQADINEALATTTKTVNPAGGADFTTLAAAFTWLNANPTIPAKVAISPGTYREGGLTLNNRDTLTILEGAAPGSVILSGSDVWTGWTADGAGNWYKPWTNNWGLRPPLNESTPGDLGLRSEMVFVNGILLRQVANLGDMADGTFHVDETTDRLTIRPQWGIQPSAATVEVSVRQNLLTINSGTSLVLRNLVFQHSSANAQFSHPHPYTIFLGGVHNDADPNRDFARHILFDRVVSRWNNASGATIANTQYITIRDSSFSHNGQTGIGSNRTRYVLWENNDFVGNNWRVGLLGGIFGDTPAGTKLLTHADALIVNCRFQGNYTAGLWFDYGSERLTVYDSVSTHNWGEGFYNEANYGPVFASGMLVRQNGHMPLAAGYAGGVLWAEAGAFTLTRSYLLDNYYYGIAARPRDRLSTAYWSGLTFDGRNRDLTFTDNVVTATRHIEKAADNSEAKRNGNAVSNHVHGTQSYFISSVIPTLAASGNRYHSPFTSTIFSSPTDPSQTGYVEVNLATWQAGTGQDANSVWDASAASSLAFDAFPETGGVIAIEAEEFHTRENCGDTVNWHTRTAYESTGGRFGYAGWAYLSTADLGGADGTFAAGTRVTYRFKVATAGPRYLAIRRYAPSTASDSVLVSVNGAQVGGSTMFSGANATPRWEWKRAAVPLGTLAAGNHTLELTRHRDGLLIDRILVADDLAKLPADGSLDEGPERARITIPDTLNPPPPPADFAVIDGFTAADYPNVNVTLAGLAPAVPGFAAAGWTSPNGNSTLRSGGLGYTDGFRTLSADPDRRVETPNNSRSGRYLDTSATGPLADRIDPATGRVGKDGTTLYLSFLMRVNKNGYNALELHNGGVGDGQRVLRIGHLDGFNTTTHFKLQRVNSSSVVLQQTTAGTVDLNTNLFVVKIEFGAGTTPGNERVTIWRNPDLASEAANAASASVLADVASFAFDRISIATFPGGENVAKTTDFDEFRLGSDWASVTPYNFVVTDGFSAVNYPAVDVQLGGQAPAISGWDPAGWTVQGANTGGMLRSGGLGYSDGSLELAAIAGPRFEASGSARVGRNLDVSATGPFADLVTSTNDLGQDGSVLYLSLLQRVETNGYNALEFHRDGVGDAQRMLQLGRLDGGASGQFALRRNTGSTTHQEALLGAADSSVNLYVVKIEFGAGVTTGNERITVWRNPALHAESANTPAAVLTDVTHFVFDRVSFANFSGGKTHMDELRLGSSWSGVTPNQVPAPATQPPVLAPGQSASGVYGQSLSYAISATNAPTSFALVGGALPPGLSLNTGTGVVFGTPTATGAFTATFTATNSIGTSAPVDVGFNIGAAAQTIAFAALADRVLGDAPFNLTATASSGLPVAYASSNPSVAVVSGSTVTVVGIGTTTITATQPGNANYLAATPVARTLTVVAAAYDLTASGLAAVNVGSGSSGSALVLSNGQWWVDGAGAGFAGTADSLRFERSAVTGDHQVVVRVRGVSGSGPLPRAGLMLRESDAAGARYVMLALPATATGSYRYSSRVAVGGSAEVEQTASGAGSSFATPDSWLLLQRSGDTVNLATAASAAGPFDVVATRTLPALASQVQVGLFAFGGAGGAATRLVADEFDIVPLDVTSGILSRWRLDQSLAAEPASYNASAVGSIGYTSGRIGSHALLLNGNNANYVAAPYVINPQTGDFTVSAWVRLDATSGNSVLHLLHQQNTTGRAWLYRRGNGVLATALGNSELAGTTVIPADGVWRHVALVKQGNTGINVRLYLNGALQASASRTVESCVGALRVGASKSPGGSNRNWNGGIDDVRVFSRALLPSEILTLSLGNP